MNCNTTHYRANSSSVPGDPTLAKHKRMSVNSCLEEMLLHTNEGVEPHTQTTLRHIQELKKRHGIDYDSHGSYRFIEE